MFFSDALFCQSTDPDSVSTSCIVQTWQSMRFNQIRAAYMGGHKSFQVGRLFGQ